MSHHQHHHHQLYRTYIQPVLLLYGSGTWALTRALQDNVDAFDNMCLRRIVHIPYTDHVTNATVRLQAGPPPQLSQLTQSRRLRFFGHVTRMDTTHQHNITRLYSAIHFSSRWKIQDRRQITDTNNTETKNNPENQTTQNTAKQNYAAPTPI